MTSAFIFPGQGSQTVGMGKALCQNMPTAAAVFEEVDSALSQNLSRLMFEGPADELTLTYNAQPALMATSVAVMRVLEQDFDLDLTDIAAYLAGHSLGEYSALAVGGALSLSDTARLLKLRGETMQRAVPVGVGAMAAVIGVDIETAEAVAVAAAEGDVCTAANDNAEGQVVLSGHKQAIERAMILAKEKGARRSILLPVSAPFHCPLMQPAAEEMAAALAMSEINTPRIPVIANVTTKPETDPNRIRTLLVEQITGRVRWRESVLAMNNLGVDTLIEAGVGKVLSGMTRRICRSMTALNLETADDIESFAKSIKS